jgi:uncharacterized membrane protein YjgN (DUF898 family)
MEARLSFDGDGGSLAGRFFVGLVVSMLTFGLFAPWMATWILQWTWEHTRLATPTGEVRFRFQGTGGALFGRLFLGGLLTVLTLGIYLPWALVSLANWALEGTEGTLNGRTFKARLDATGGEALPLVLKGVLLSVVTLGIYAPWFACGLCRWAATRTRIQAEGSAPLEASFGGTGGELLVLAVVGGVLTSATFGLFGPFFQVALWRFFTGRTRITIQGVAWAGEFTGTGWGWFQELFVGILLTIVTLGIYLPWLVARQARFRLNHTQFLGPGAASKSAPPFLGIPGF